MLGALISLLPTVGSIISGLLPAKTLKEGKYSLRLSSEKAADNSCTADFFNDGNQFYVYNTSNLADDYFSIYFPRKGDMPPATLEIYGGEFCELTNYFKGNAKYDNSVFELSYAKDKKASGIKQHYLSYFAYKIPIGDGKNYSLDESEKVCVFLEPESITVKLKEIKIQSILYLCVKGSGDTSVQLRNIPGNSQTEIMIPFPILMQKDDLVYIEVVIIANQENMGHLYNKSKTSILKLSEQQLSDCLKAKQLNKRYPG